MNRRTANRLLAVALVALALTVVGRSEEPGKKAAVEKYTVLAGNCEKSVKEISTHGNAVAAFDAAQAARKDNSIVRITTGKMDKSLQSCTVHIRGCRTPWIVTATTRRTLD